MFIGSKTLIEKSITSKSQTGNVMESPALRRRDFFTVRFSYSYNTFQNRSQVCSTQVLFSIQDIIVKKSCIISPSSVSFENKCISNDLHNTIFNVYQLKNHKSTY